MRTLVTGAAGFIGSHLCQALARAGHEVLAVDSFTDYYDVARKRANAHACAQSGVHVIEADLRAPEVLALLAETDTVFHLAAQPGVRSSWAAFPTYQRVNVEVTHALLEAARALPVAPRVVLASSSSVYGEAADTATELATALRPRSPYGVSKLGMEQLAAVYADAGLPIVVLRYFTVYGPRQRPDMAVARFVEAMLSGDPVPVLGSGEQQRSLTYVDDVVDATVRAATAPHAPGATVNVAGSESISVNALVSLLGELLECGARVQHLPPAPGDVELVTGSSAAAARLLGWAPSVRLVDGLARQVEWQRELARVGT